MKNILIIIPSLDPDEKIIEVVKSLKEIGFDKILLVDDGSAHDKKNYFSLLVDEYGCKLITHDVNLGKGVALKHAYKYALDNYDDIDGVISVDGDNQHKSNDVLACAFKFLENKNKLVLGVRDFTNIDNIPARSHIGNNFTKNIFGFLTGRKLSDTQTGLRVISIKYLPSMIAIDGNRFEYEMNVLLSLRKLSIDIVEVPIETIYINENETSHFRPILDSFKILGVVFRFLISSIICSLIDIILFSVIVYSLFGGVVSAYDVVFANVFARVVSSLINFLLNYKSVFESRDSFKGALFKYYFLVIFIMILSSLITAFLANRFMGVVPIKIFVDILLFFLSYYIQKNYVFS